MSIHEIISSYVTGEVPTINSKSVTVRLSISSYCQLAALASSMNTSASGLLKTLSEQTIKESVDCYLEIGDKDAYDERLNAIHESMFQEQLL